MKRLLLFFFISFLFSSCFLSLDHGPIPNMTGKWMIKNWSSVNIELSGEAIMDAYIAVGDSVVIFIVEGENTYTPPRFDEFLNIDAISIRLAGSDDNVSDSILWVNSDLLDLKHQIFNETSWKCYRNDIGEPTWVFTITDQDIASH